MNPHEFDEAMAKLGANGRFGGGVDFTGNLDIDESKMSVWIPFADGNKRDGVGDLLEVSGIDFSRHKNLPNVLFDHGKETSLPLGLACERDERGRYDYTKYTVQVDPLSKSARLNAFFYQGKGMGGDDVHADQLSQHALFCEQLYHMVAMKMLGAGSIGYQVIQATPLQPDYQKGIPQGLHLQKVLMLEGSLVVMPANQDTVRKALSLNKVCGKPLSPVLVKSLSPYAPARKVQMGWEKKAKGDRIEVHDNRVVSNFTFPHEYETDSPVESMEMAQDEVDSQQRTHAHLYGQAQTVPVRRERATPAHPENAIGKDGAPAIIDMRSQKDLPPRQGEVLQGGMADGMDASRFDPEELSMGLKVELEHTNDPKAAIEIAMDHLAETPDYYSRLTATPGLKGLKGRIGDAVRGAGRLVSDVIRENVGAVRDVGDFIRNPDEFDGSVVNAVLGDRPTIEEHTDENVRREMVNRTEKAIAPKQGDRVRVNDPRSAYHGRRAEVTEVGDGYVLADPHSPKGVPVATGLVLGNDQMTDEKTFDPNQPPDTATAGGTDHSPVLGRKGGDPESSSGRGSPHNPLYVQEVAQTPQGTFTHTETDRRGHSPHVLHTSSDVEAVRTAADREAEGHDRRERRSGMARELGYEPTAHVIDRTKDLPAGTQQVRIPTGDLSRTKIPAPYAEPGWIQKPPPGRKLRSLKDLRINFAKSLGIKSGFFQRGAPYALTEDEQRDYNRDLRSQELNRKMDHQGEGWANAQHDAAMGVDDSLLSDEPDELAKSLKALGIGDFELEYDPSQDPHPADEDLEAWTDEDQREWDEDAASGWGQGMRPDPVVESGGPSDSEVERRVFNAQHDTVNIRGNRTDKALDETLKSLGIEVEKAVRKPVEGESVHIDHGGRKYPATVVEPLLSSRTVVGVDQGDGARSELAPLDRNLKDEAGQSYGEQKAFVHDVTDMHPADAENASRGGVTDVRTGTGTPVLRREATTAGTHWEYLGDRSSGMEEAGRYWADQDADDPHMANHFIDTADPNSGTQAAKPGVIAALRSHGAIADLKSIRALYAAKGRQ